MNRNVDEKLKLRERMGQNQIEKYGSIWSDGNAKRQQLADIISRTKNKLFARMVFCFFFFRAGLRSPLARIFRLLAYA